MLLLIASSCKIVSDLCEPPYWQLVILAKSASIAFRAYCFYMAQDWNACLFDPKTKAVFASFQQGLLASKVAHLWYKKERSDKVYHLYLAHEPNAEFYTVIRRYGKRDGVLKQREKSFNLLQEAEKKWQKILERKINKGYKQHKTFHPIQLELELQS